MITNNLFPVLFREQIIKSVREFFYRKDFHEVVIPVFNTSLPLEQNIYPFKATWDNLKGKKDFYLSTSPEAYLKKMIAIGMGNCFGIGHSFRNMEGAGPFHNPEFLMLEWYREEATYEDIMRETRDLLLSINKDIHPRKGRPCEAKWPIVSMVDLFKKYAKLDLEEFCNAEFISASNSNHKGIPPRSASRRIGRDDILSRIRERGYTIHNASWEQIFNQIFLNEIEHHLPKDPSFLIDYPARISALCAKRTDKPYLAERFELYINGIEIGNGNTENTDTEDVVRSMKREEKYRKKMGILSPPIDTDFIKALDYMKNKKYAGIGLGMERLVMIMTGNKNIFNLS